MSRRAPISATVAGLLIGAVVAFSTPSVTELLPLPALVVAGWAAVAVLWAVAGAWLFSLWRARRRGKR